jgi:N-acetylmuramoyl-L-alanine amidase
MPAFTVVSHRLHLDGRPVAYRETPNIGRALRPELLVMHYTGSSSYSSAVNWLCDKRAAASAHLVISEKGEITQLAPFNRVTWHAGASAYKGRSGCNGFALGIELVNAGLLQRNGAGGFEERLGRKPVPASEVIIARHKRGGSEEPWAAYAPAQMEVAIEVATALATAYSLADIVGHDDVAPGRKIDPGPAFPMTTFRSRALGRREAR